MTLTPDQTDQQRFDAAASWAATQLATRGVARLRFAPGDMTEYPILIAAPGTVYVTGPGEVAADTYWVALCASFGTGYPWRGQPVDAGYATEKWTARSLLVRVWTGEIMARFLTALSEALENVEVADPNAFDDPVEVAARFLADMIDADVDDTTRSQARALVTRLNQNNWRIQRP